MARAVLQIYAHLLTIWNGSYKKIWAFKGWMAHFKKDCKVPSMGWSWARSGTIKISDSKK